MQILFVDESNPAPAQITRSSKRYFVLGGVAVPELNWHSLSRTLNNIKSHRGIRGEVKWRYFSPHNNDRDNPMRHLNKLERDEVREDMFAALRTRHHICSLAVVASVHDALQLPYVNNDDDLYFYCLKILTERFQYRIQEVNREYNINRHGIVVIDGRDPGKDDKIREMHDRLVTQQSAFSSDYNNLVEGLFIAASHLSPGTQFADLIAGATHHYFSRGFKHWLERGLPTFRQSEDGRVEGRGIAFFPNTEWKIDPRRRVGELTPSAR